MKYVDVIFHSQLLNSIKSDIKTSEEVIVRKYGDRIFVNTDKEEYVFYTPNLDYVTSGAESLDLKAAMSNSFGFGGGNACLVIKKYGDIDENS